MNIYEQDIDIISHLGKYFKVSSVNLSFIIFLHNLIKTLCFLRFYLVYEILKQVTSHWSLSRQIEISYLMSLLLNK